VKCPFSSCNSPCSPPFVDVENLGGRFIAITEARDVGNLELALLRKAYEIL